jgi:hypothetical protein
MSLGFQSTGEIHGTPIIRTGEPSFLLFKQALYRMVLSRPRLKIRQDNHLLVCLDEYTRMMLAHDSLASEHVVME